jgi:hypothetical protein
MIHMGGDVSDLDVAAAIPVTVAGALTVPATGGVRRAVRLAMDRIFEGATRDVDLTGFPFSESEIAAGERLRRSGATLPLFTFAP